MKRRVIIGTIKSEIKMNQRNLVAKYSRQFNKASVVPDKKKTYKRNKRVHSGEY